MFPSETCLLRLPHTPLSALPFHQVNPELGHQWPLFPWEGNRCSGKLNGVFKVSQWTAREPRASAAGLARLCHGMQGLTVGGTASLTMALDKVFPWASAKRSKVLIPVTKILKNPKMLLWPQLVISQETSISARFAYAYQVGWWEGGEGHNGMRITVWQLEALLLKFLDPPSS